ncbi:T-cell-interacting, activating receptor on myeloid cells protein 1-like isoform X3 [Vulpes lagopus]|uniref:T-cell-interacting, activating receptor on myeloid cells protein 1-like isoform X3 n=1 Tax=Vulpes lagopus TaxID=494514 RepID=UPI001BC9DEE1|nr:T-cell-interacting, activating receptor on myeloid cells protein 1-like isoform X3 [Vulpes lagopus]
MAAMMSQLLVVLYTGLCAGRRNRMTDETLPKPSLSAWPSWVMPPKSNVTLQCHTSTNDVNFALRKGNVPVEFPQSPDSTEGMARFLLTDLQASNSGPYTCEYYRREPPQISSQPSDSLLLLVTGEFPKPSLQAHQRGVVTARENVTLQCQRLNNSFESVMFALLKAGAAEPIRVQGPAKEKMDFSLRSVTVSDAGNYSCVYFLMKAPFWASEPSNHLEITVKGTVELTLIVIFILLFILGVFLIYKYTRCGAAPNKMTKCSRSSKDPQEQRTSVQPGKESDDLSMAITSCSPALDKASQVSRAEEPHTVTYAELNTRALREGLSRQMEQPLETCVYSTLKG